MIVQIYEVSSSREARRLADLGVDHIGVLVGDGEFPREIGTERTREIFAAVPARAKKVALSLSYDPAVLHSIVEQTGPDILHLGTTPGPLSPDDVRELKRKFPGLPVMRTLPVVDDDCVTLAKRYDGVADYLLLDTHEDGEAQIGATGKTHDWGLSRRIVESVSVPVILAGGLGPDNVARAIRKVGPAGVDSKTKTDRPDGRGKDTASVRRFVDIAKSF